MSIATDGFGTIVSGLETGGGGGSVIPPDGDLSGSYEGTVVCEGNVTLTGNLDLKGNLIVLGDFVNDGGYEVNIRGSLTAQSILFDKADTSTPQQNFSVGGDLMFTYMEFRQCGGTAAQLRVGGDLIGTAGFAGTSLYGEGVTSGTNGLDIVVYGDMTVTYVNVDGADGTTSNAGNGGTVYVYGNLSGDYYFTSSGGNATDYDAGNGGDIYVRGDFNFGWGSVALHGGDATNGNGGRGGDLEVACSMVVNELEVYGGSCNSDSENFSSGIGGHIQVDGNLIVNDYISLNGGDRSGTLSAGNTLSPPNAGDMDIYGDLIIDGDFAGDGGDVYTDNFAPHDAGSGSDVYIAGKLTCTDDFRARGGYANIGNAGNGGTLEVEHEVYVDDELEFYGGSSNNGNGGGGGTANFRSSAHIDEVDFDGGSGNNGNGGYGGVIDVRGILHLTSFIDVNGGDCNSTNENHVPGSGGSIDCRGLNAEDTNINLNGGDRFGATTVSATGNPAMNAGSLYCYGDCVAYNVEADGGSVSTGYPNAPGGSGGSLYFYGTTHIQSSVNINGGSSVGNAGGNGGYLSVNGHATMDYIYCNGGASNNSVLGGDATNEGSGGTLTFRKGVVCNSVYLEDGTGLGGAPGSNSTLNLAGSCTFYEISMGDRGGNVITAFSSIPVTLKVSSMPSKQTLNDSGGVATGNINANLGDSIFFTAPSSVWYKVTGATV